LRGVVRGKEETKQKVMTGERKTTGRPVKEKRKERPETPR